MQRKDTYGKADIEGHTDNINKTKSVLPPLIEERESKSSKRKNKHFIDIHDSDEEDRLYMEAR